MSKRIKTNYPGVYYREAKRIGGKGIEKVYYVVFKKNGKAKEEKVGRQFADDITPARAFLYRAERIEGKRPSRREIRELEERQKAAEASKYTIDLLWTEYKKNRNPGKSLSTDSSRYGKYIKPVFEKKEPHELIRSDVDQLRNKLSKALSPQTVKHVLNLLTWIINFGVKNNLCQGISFHIQKPTVNNQRTEDLTPEQLKRLLNVIEKYPNAQVANMMKLALFTGMRRGELFKLKWGDIDFERGFIRIRGPKGGQDATIPMNHTAHELLKSHPRLNSDYVFLGKNGNQRTNVTWHVNRIKKEAGLPDDFRPLHGLRHVYASMLASSGKVDMYTLQKLLTHKSPQMTQRYAHLRDETLKNASDLADEIIGDVMQSSAGEKKK
jgi:integrase